MKSQDLNHQADPPDGSYSPEAQTETATLEQPLQKTIVLVHAAWLGKWQWNAVVPYLEKEGFRVQAPDLPGHGKDTTPPGIITMEDYVNQLVEILDGEKQPVLLVGHSFNGITISQVGELRPEKISGLVYLAAFLAGRGILF